MFGMKSMTLKDWASKKVEKLAASDFLPLPSSLSHGQSYRKGHGKKDEDELLGPWKRAWGRPPRGEADKDIHIACSKCAVTFVHTVADQVTFKNKNFAAPRKCLPCVQSTKAAKFVLYKAQLVTKKLAKKQKKQTLRSATALASG